MIAAGATVELDVGELGNRREKGTRLEPLQHGRRLCLLVDRSRPATRDDLPIERVDQDRPKLFMVSPSTRQNPGPVDVRKNRWLGSFSSSLEHLSTSIYLFYVNCVNNANFHLRRSEATLFSNLGKVKTLKMQCRSPLTSDNRERQGNLRSPLAVFRDQASLRGGCKRWLQAEPVVVSKWPIAVVSLRLLRERCWDRRGHQSSGRCLLEVTAERQEPGHADSQKGP